MRGPSPVVSPEVGEEFVEVVLVDLGICAGSERVHEADRVTVRIERSGQARVIREERVQQLVQSDDAFIVRSERTKVVREGAVAVDVRSCGVIGLCVEIVCEIVSRHSVHGHPKSFVVPRVILDGSFT
jgi:hypothetical protein